VAFAGFPSNMSGVVPTTHGGGFAIGVAGARGGAGGGFPPGAGRGTGGTGVGAGATGAAGVGGGANGRFPLGSGACDVTVGGMGLT
jgi:hypothetical protein